MKETQPKLACPHCGGFCSHVVNSRPAHAYETFRRWRVCDTCGKRFLTEERIVQALSSPLSTRVNI